MKELIRLQQKIAPELIKVVERRYTILQTVFYCQPIGRRSLAKKIGISERKVRKNLDFLKENYFVNSTAAGVKITQLGTKLFHQLDNYIKTLRDLDNLELELERRLDLAEVAIVPTGLDYINTQQELGRLGAKLLLDKLEEDSILAVSGGSTLAAVADTMFVKQKLPRITVVPARGGLGGKVEIQANSIAAQIADKLGGHYHLLHLPDNLDEDLISALVKNSQIKEILQLAQSADILIHGIGKVEVMAQRRQINQEQLDQLLASGAVGEAFGYYFNQAGEVVFSIASVGLQLDELSAVDTTIAIAGGADKARAIIAVIKNGQQDVLITDQEAAEEMVDLLRR
ncbi:MAG: sugar-binding transcriptional regulator [Bacillota bacterium]